MKNFRLFREFIARPEKSRAFEKSREGREKTLPGEVKRNDARR